MATPTYVIEPPRGRRLVDWRELLTYGDLLYYLVHRDVKVRYVQSVLGFSWALIRPLASTAVFSVVFGKLAEVPSDDIPYPLFTYAALVPWTYFSGSLASSAGSMAGNPLMSKVYFPRLFLPLTPVLSNLVDFFVALIPLIFLMLRYQVFPDWRILALPFLLVLMVVATSGVGLWLSALAVQYRDVKFALGFATSLLMYAAPIVWPASLVPESYRLLYGLYPLAGIVEGFRSALLGRPLPLDLLATGTLSAIVIWVTGAYYFRQRERVFADVF